MAILQKDTSADWFNRFVDSINGTRDGLVSGINSILQTVYEDQSKTLEEKVAIINDKIAAPAQVLGVLLAVRTAINSIDDNPIGEFTARDGTYLTADENGKLVIVSPPPVI